MIPKPRQTIEPLSIGEIRPLTREDLAEIMVPPKKSAVARLRDPHHHAARLIAAGVRPMEEVARRTGYSRSRLYVLTLDPTFQELVASYRTREDASFYSTRDDYYETATANMLKAEVQIAEKLEAAEETGELLPIRDLLAISRDAADRFGYGKKTTNLNVNVDFASKLEKAIERSAARSIDHSPSISPDASTASPVIARRA